MTPMFMLKDAESRFDGRHDEFSEYLRTEYGSAETAWILADGAESEKRSDGEKFSARFLHWLSKRTRSAAASGSEV